MTERVVLAETVTERKDIDTDIDSDCDCDKDRDIDWFPSVIKNIASVHKIFPQSDKRANEVITDTVVALN